uniref:Ty3 transposon capsid-like protein domain-containing protein n=1 Tax=Anopheles minimus TaxID=112268 RepID=A0A182W811_9DIPT
MAEVELKVKRMDGPGEGLMTALEAAAASSNGKKKALPTMADNGAQHMRLPKISKPELSGRYEDWLDFHDLFVSLVHNNKGISGIQKMCYMRSSLKGEALKVIDTFPSCEASYEVAWETLNKRYNNKYVLIKQHVNALINWPKLKAKSTEAIHALVDGFDRNTKLLAQLGEDASGYGMLLTQLLVSKLDEETKHDWEVQVETTGKY